MRNHDMTARTPARRGRLRRRPVAVLRAAAILLVPVVGMLVTNEAVLGQRRSDARFSHEPHRNVTCVACHTSNAAGLGPAHVTERQCQSCHHTGEVGAACTRCHAATELVRPFPTVQKFRLSVMSEPVSRTLQLSHQQHSSLACRTCHNKPPQLSAKALPCGSCHEQHHTPDADCRACHESRPGGAHGNAVHLGCGGSDCHRSNPVPATTRTRQMCLTCHADRAAHFPAANCVECHALPMGAKGQPKR